MRYLLLSTILLTSITQLAQAQAPDAVPAKLPDADVSELIQQLGNDDFQTREQAVEKLVELGEPVRAAVEKATESDDAEIATRAKQVLKKLDTKDIDEALVHVVGLYESRDQLAVVKVNADDKPIILVLCAYEGVTWDVQPAKGARIVQVIASGYHQQAVRGVDVPVTTFSYDQRSPFYFYTYDHDEERFPDMLARVKELTGKAPATFQGRYGFKSQAFEVPFRF